MKRKTLFKCFLILLLFCMLFVFRHQAVVMGTRLCLSKCLPSNFTYKGISQEEGRISIKGLSVMGSDMEMTFDSVEYSFDIKRVLTHPKSLISLFRKEKPHWSQYLANMKEYGMDLDAQNGVLQLDESRYYFSFTKGDKRHEIGTLNVFVDPSLKAYPFMVVQFHVRGDQIITQLKVDDIDSQRLIQLGAFAFADYFNGIESSRGSVQLHASIIFEKDGRIDEVSTRVNAHDLIVQIPERGMALNLERFSGELNYPEGAENAGLPMWKRMQCHLTLESGNVILSDQMALSGLDGTLGLDPRVDPALSLKGDLVLNEKSLAMKLSGKGAIHEDHAYWLEFDLNLDDRKGASCDAFLSVCSPEKDSHVIQLEATNLIPEQVEMLKGYFARSMPRIKQWHIDQGSFGGKVVALFEKGNLSHFEIQDLKCENVAFTKDEEVLFLSQLSGSGRLFEELNFEMNLPISHAFGLISKELRQDYDQYLPDDFANLYTTIRFEEGSVKTSASIDFTKQNESLQFGFTSNQAFPNSLDEISKGWARSEKLTHNLYGPIIRKFGEDLKLFGEVDLIASFDGLNFDLALQVDNLLAKHPLFDLRVPFVGEKQQTQGRIKFSCNSSDGTYKGILPLKGAMVYDRRLGLVFEGLDTKIELVPEKISGRVLDGCVSFDSHPLLTGTQFDFSVDETTSVSNLFAKLPLDSDKEFFLKATSLNPSHCDFALLEGESELSHFNLEKEGDWKGTVSINALEKTLQLEGGWDPINGNAQLSAFGDQVSLQCSKKGSDYVIEHFEIGDISCKGTVSKETVGFSLKEIELKRSDLILSGLGKCEIDLPKDNQVFGFRAQLQLDAELLAPTNVLLKSAGPISIAFSPSLGWIATDADFSCNGCTISWGHIEHLFSSGSTNLFKGKFDLSESFCSQLTEGGLLPGLLQDFRVCRGLKGGLSLITNKGKVNALGVLDTKLGDLPFDLEWKGPKGVLKLGKEQSLLIETSLGDQGLQIEEMVGELGRFKSKIKKVGLQKLKGHVEVDFSLFGEVFDIPLNRYLKIWKTGGGYHFDGLFAPGKRLEDWNFKGKVTGHSFECGGYQLRSMEAKVDIASGQITIENVDVTDDAGKAWVGEGAVMRSGGAWVFSFPLVEIRGFQPSFLHKMEGPEKGINPLVIKSATLRDVRGRIDDPRSISASGSLRFTNVSNQGERKLPKNLPEAALKQMGLNGSLFMPASGEMDYIIQNGRCYLRELHSVVSDKNQSEFSPPRNGVMGYLDFDGSLFIDMQVKQKVNRSISGPISLKVRGTWEDPDITIK